MALSKWGGGGTDPGKGPKQNRGSGHRGPEATEIRFFRGWGKMRSGWGSDVLKGFHPVGGGGKISCTE